MRYYLYWIRTKDHDDIMTQGYIGVSNNVERRFLEHKKNPQNRHLKFAIEKYKWDNLLKTVLLIAEKDYCLDIERKLRPEPAIGWNIVAGGGAPPIMSGPQPHLCGRPSGNKGKSLSKETRQLIREAALAQWQDPAQRELLSSIKRGKPSNMKGKKHSQETKDKIRAAKLGKPSKKKGVKVSPEARANVIAATSIKWVCPHCNKEGVGKGAAKRWHFDACRNKEKL